MVEKSFVCYWDKVKNEIYIKTSVFWLRWLALETMTGRLSFFIVKLGLIIGLAIRVALLIGSEIAISFLKDSS